jgi:ATP-binding cassette subfamily D (ALD) long-chain fatty acid import protein
MAATEARLEGEYRAGLGRIGRDGEEVAYVLYFRSFALLPVTLMVDRFYNGGKRENGILSRAYDQVAKHVHTVFKVRQYHSFTPASMLIDRLEYLTGKLTCDGNHES